MKFGTGSNAERTQKYGGSKYKMTYIRPNISTNIPDFQLCYPCKCLAGYARSPIMVEGRSKQNGIMKSLGTLIQRASEADSQSCSIEISDIYYWLASVASETLTGVTQLKIGDVCLFIWTYVCHFVL